MIVIDPAIAADVLVELPVLLYVGPDQILPLTSILGGIVGLLLLLWHRILSAGSRLTGFVTRLARKPKIRNES